MIARDEVLGRVERAQSVEPTAYDVPRLYRRAGVDPWSDEQLCESLIDRLVDYKASVVTCATLEIPDAVARIVRRRRATRIVVPDGAPREWLPHEVDAVEDAPPLSAVQLDELHGVLTTSSVAIAETGTIVLDGGAGMGRRILTLIPDLHIVVVRVEDIVRGVPEALTRLDPSRPQTWISGPSATSDIELERVEGVHGPRILEVVIAG